MVHRSLALFLVFPTFVYAQQSYPPSFPGATEHVYKTVGDVQLKLWMFQPDGHMTSDKRPAAVFFFGGGWRKGNPSQFEHHCRYLASRGMVAMTADYRVSERHQTKAESAVMDAKSAIRWIREHADQLGIDADRIVAGGGSAGGHLACCAATVSDFDNDASVSSVPNALALFNPAVLLAPFEGLGLEDEKLEDIKTRIGPPPQRISPIHHVSKGQPPAIIFHGTNDDAVPFETVRLFSRRYNDVGNECVLKPYDDQPHGFFNYGRGGIPGENYLRTVQQMDQFLVKLGYLSGPSTIQLPESQHAHLRSDFQNCRIKFEQEKVGSVAFIGGSITEMNGYRPLVMEFLQKRFPETDFTFTNAGISSTCSTTGAFRLERDVLSSNPDLVFVEFAVNDDQDAAHAARECVRGMEGILRRCRMDAPQANIIVTHFVNPPMLEKIQGGESPISSSQHERVAFHYGVSTNYVAAELADRIAAKTFSWKEYGGTHPKKPGNQLAADMISQILSAAWALPLSDDAKQKKIRLPKVLDAASYFYGSLVGVDQAKITNGWKVEVPDWKSLGGGKRQRFTELPLLCSTEPGAEFEVRFGGTALGLYVLAGPDAGTVEYSIDGSEFKKADLYHRFSKGLHYPRTVILDADLKRGKHVARVRVSEDHHPDSKGTAIRILEFAVNAGPSKKP